MHFLLIIQSATEWQLLVNDYFRYSFFFTDTVEKSVKPSEFKVLWGIDSL